MLASVPLAKYNVNSVKPLFSFHFIFLAFSCMMSFKFRFKSLIRAYIEILVLCSIPCTLFTFFPSSLTLFSFSFNKIYINNTFCQIVHRRNPFNYIRVGKYINRCMQSSAK